MSSVLWTEGARKRVYHLIPLINGSVVKEVRGNRPGSPKFKEGHPFLLPFLPLPPQLLPITGLDLEVLRKINEKSNVFSDLHIRGSTDLSLEHFHLIF